MTGDTTHEIPGGTVRVYPPNRDEGDLGTMYVLDVLGCTLLIREREDGTYIHIDDEGSTPTDGSEPTDPWPFIVEVNNGGANYYGESRRGQDDDSEPCDECGEDIPGSEPGMVNAHHDESCSLHPDNAA